MPTPLWLPLRNFQSFLAPDTLNALLVHQLADIPQQRRDPPVAVAAIDSLLRDRPHVSPGCRLANRLCVIAVIPTALDEGLHLLRRDQLYPIIHGAKHPAPMMSACTCCQRNLGGLHFGKEGFNLRPSGLAAENSVSCPSTPCSVKICFDV